MSDIGRVLTIWLLQGALTTVDCSFSRCYEVRKMRVEGQPKYHRDPEV